jgi:hypothetical protein
MDTQQRKEIAETRNLLTKQEKVSNFVDSSEWDLVKACLTEKLADAGSILGLESKDADSLFKEVAARQLAVEIIREWLTEIEGIAVQYKENKKSLNQHPEDQFIRTYE